VALLPWVERDVSLPRLTLHLRELASDGPPLLLLHGLSVDGSVWQAVSRRLYPAHSIIAADLRGHGYSDHPHHGYDAVDYAADVAELLDEIAAATGPIDVLGHSLGALAALGAAALRSEQVRRLVLEEPPLGGPGPTLPYLRAVSEAKQEGHVAITAVVRRYQPGLGDLIGKVQTGMWERVAPQAIGAVLDHPDSVFTVGDWLDRVTAATLLMQADPAVDARLTTVDAEHAIGRLRQGRLIQVQGAGHVIHADRLTEFCQVVTEFLRA